MTHEDLSDLIGLIYDCALDPDLWPAAMRRIVDAADAAAGMCVVHDFEANASTPFFDVGVPPEHMRLFVERYAAENPIAHATALRWEGAVDTLATLFRDDRWERSATAREWVPALGVRDVLGVAVLRNERRGVWLGAMRAAARGRFGPAEVELFRLLAPHLCRAMRIADVLDMRGVAADRLAETLDALATPVFLLDGEGRVAHRNEAAERMAERGRPVRVVAGRLAAAHRPAEAPLAAAVRGAVAGEVEPARAPGAVPLGDGQLGDRAIATVLPLGARRAGRFARPGAAAAAVFVQDAGLATPLLPAEAFAALYGLTPAELRVVVELGNGLTPREAAEALGVGEATVKTHLVRAFEKTGTARQAELVRLLMASAAPLRPG